MSYWEVKTMPNGLTPPPCSGVPDRGHQVLRTTLELPPLGRTAIDKNGGA
jgi:hypothetical protein